MSFCYIKYSASVLHSFRLSRGENSNKGLKSFRSKIHVAPSALSEISGRIMMSKSAVMKSRTALSTSVVHAQENENELLETRYTNQLASEKSMEMLEKLRGHSIYFKKRHQENVPDPQRRSSTEKSFDILNQVHLKEKKLSVINTDSQKSSKSYSVKNFRGKKMRPVFNETNHSIMINPDCYVQIIIDYVYQMLSLDKAAVNLDLCDEDGRLLELHLLQPYQSGLTKLTNRKTYYLIAYERDGDYMYKYIMAMIKKTNKQETDVISKLEKNTSSLIRPKSSQSLNNYGLKISRKKSRQSSSSSSHRKESPRST